MNVMVRRLPALLPALLLLALALPATAAARVTNGEQAGPADYAWTVALVVHGRDPFYFQFCGGSLIAPDVVLTAAHCTMGSRADEIDVFAGDRDLSDAGPGETFTVDSIRMPSEAEVDPDSEFAPPRNDMAVLELSSPVPIGANAQTIAPVAPSPAPELDWAPGDDLEVMGWGITAFDPPGDPDGDPSFPDVLHHATTPRVSDADCESDWGADFFGEDMVCALGVAGNEVRDACSGDSGGPLTTHTAGADPTDASDWKLVGTVSFGSASCTNPALSGVYARAAAPNLNAFIEDFRDGIQDAGPDADPAPQLEQADGAPALDGMPVVGQKLTCGEGTTTWTDTPGTLSTRIRGYDATFGEYFTVAIDEPYTLTSDDQGFRFTCEIHARKDGVGGYGVARSGLSAPVAAAQTSTGTGTTTTPPPPVVIVAPPPSDPQPFVPEPPRDTAAPRAALVSRSCTRKRVCRLIIGVDDAQPSAGIKSVTARITYRVRRACTLRGRRRTCIETRRRTVTARTIANVFVAQTPRLPKGRTTVLLTATDLAGNVQSVPTIARFRLR